MRNSFNHLNVSVSLAEHQGGLVNIVVQFSDRSVLIVAVAPLIVDFLKVLPINKLQPMRKKTNVIILRLVRILRFITFAR